ncbi:mucin-21-like [Dermacentor albipictus]|uniref:mucin-21-like n=1 Tax=Dermacentor albipictus TaxID=60249 RepID=UPI0038FCB5BF
MEENKDAQPPKTGPVPPTQDAPTTRGMKGQGAHPEGHSREDLSSKDRLQDAAERTSSGTTTAESLERQTVTEAEQTASAADPVLLPEVREELGLLAKPGTPAPAATAIHNETAEHSRSAAASPDAAPKNTATATTKESAVAENASVQATNGHEQGGRPELGGQWSSAQGPPRTDFRDRLQDAAERTSCGTATAKSLERQTATEPEQTASAADPVLLSEVREELGLLAKPGTPAPAATAIHNETAEHSRSAAASPDAAPKNTATATTKESAVAENASVQATKAHEQGGRPELGGQRSSAKPALPHSPNSTSGATTPFRQMEESMDRSVDRQLRPLRKSWKLKAACFTLTMVLLIVGSGFVVYK